MGILPVIQPSRSDAYNVTSLGMPVHLLRRRLLLGPDAKESEPQDDPAADEQEEIPRSVGSYERLAQEQSKELADSADSEQFASASSWLLELLCSHQQLDDDLALSRASDASGLQMAQS